MLDAADQSFNLSCPRLGFRKIQWALIAEGGDRRLQPLSSDGLVPAVQGCSSRKDAGDPRQRRWRMASAMTIALAWERESELTPGRLGMVM